jgi:hypothetical protein
MQRVFVLDQQKRPLMPCRPARAGRLQPVVPAIRRRGTAPPPSSAIPRCKRRRRHRCGMRPPSTSRGGRSTGGYWRSGCRWRRGPVETGTGGDGDRWQDKMEPGTAGHAQDPLAGCGLCGRIDTGADPLAECGATVHHRAGPAQPADGERESAGLSPWQTQGHQCGGWVSLRGTWCGQSCPSRSRRRASMWGSSACGLRARAMSQQNTDELVESPFATVGRCSAWMATATLKGRGCFLPRLKSGASAPWTGEEDHSGYP